MKILLYGATGWIGSQLYTALSKSHQVFKAKARLDDYVALVTELTKHENILTHVVMAAGLTGRPNVDWCEDHKTEVISVNVLGTMIVGEFCEKNKLHFTYLGTGCIYEYDKDHTVDTKGFTEKDEPNFSGSFYSKTKIVTQNILSEYGCALILRVRMPISDDLHSRNFITKITKYEKVVNVPNSMTVLYDLLPLIPVMMFEKYTGTINFTNPGNISHNEILDLYTKYIDPEFKYQNFSLEEQSKILKAGRSNNTLDSSKLLGFFPKIPHIKDSIISVFIRMKKNLKK